MGGSGGSGSSGGGFKRPPEELESLRQQVRQDLQRQELLAQENEFLAERLVELNDRDAAETRQRLEEVERALERLGHDVEELLFGGSVAKHTYVNGLSDVDALVFLGGDQADSPAEVLASFARALQGQLPTGEIESVTTGHMAITVTYRDGTEIQLLPAVERAGHTVIPSENGMDWRQVRPHKFAEKLTQVNQANGKGVVPAIKLAKSLIDKLPDDQHLSGYHVEAIAVDAFKTYGGPRDRASMLSHLIHHASEAVLRPTGDITGQSVHIDQWLGPASSVQRQAVSRSLRRLATELDSAASVASYARVFDD